MRMRSWSGLGAATVVCLLALADPSAAQQTTGSIRGQVVSTEGEALAGAQITVRNVSTGLTRTSISSERGRFAVLLLPPGTYRIEAEIIGFAPEIVEGIAVRVGEVTPVDLRLRPRAVVLEGIEVTAERARLDPRQGGVMQTVTSDQVESLPTLGRDFTDFLNLSPLVSPQPGVTTGGQFSIGGARTSGTNVQIDGTDANNVFFGENRGSSRTPFAFSLESIQEFQLVTNGFDVEYGSYSGGVVNAVTKGGTNAWRGGGFLYLRDEALTASDFAGNPPSDFSVQQFGFNVSGPIVRDKAHFFVSADGQRKDQPLFALTPEASGVPEASINEFQRILRDVYGLEDPEAHFGRFTQDEDNLVLFGRIDWNINDNHRVTLRQNYSDFEQTNDRISTNEALSQGGPFQNETFSTVAELNSIFGSSAFNTLRFQWSYEDRPRPANGRAGYIPEITIRQSDSPDMDFGGDGIIFRNRLEEEKLQLIDNFTWQRGDHTVKLGTNNIFSTTTNTFWLLGAGDYTFNSLADFENANPSSYFRLTRACPEPLQPNAAGEPVICPEYDVPFAKFDAIEYSVYAQDEWQATDRLLLIGGLRFQGQTFGDEPGRVQAAEDTFGIATGEAPGFSGFSPRFAFTYDLADERPALVRGGVGLLVGRVPTVLAGNVFQTEKPLLSVFCSGDAVPTLDLQELLSVPQGENNPIACAGGEAPSGRPDFTFFSDDFGLPKTLKANVGYERVLGLQTKIGLDLIYSRTWDNFNVIDLNLQDQQFTLASEQDRPVFVAEDRYNPTRRAGSSRLASNAFNRVFLNVSESEAEAWNLALELEQPVGEDLQFGVRYAYTRAFDNSSYSCCTAQEGFERATFGDPNFIGDIGDDARGAWGPSDFERRHAVVANVMWNAPFRFEVNGIWRSQSGTPFTPIVDGDINGDDLDSNDRAMISRDLRFETPEEAAAFESILGEWDCLRDQLGSVASRNSCRGPWFHSLDLRISREFPTFSGQRAELLVDLFNVLNGLNSDWGRFVGMSREEELLVAEGFETGEVIYSVNEGFGTARTVGFDPFQFQAQIGIRYRF